MNIFDLHYQYNYNSKIINNAITKVLNHQKFINGPEVKRFEELLVDHTKSKYVLSCANGTDALTIISKMLNLSNEEVVLVPAFSYIASADAFKFLNNSICFVDVDPESYTICPNSLKSTIKVLKQNNKNPRVLVIVDLFGRPSHYRELLNIAKENKLTVITDGAQSFGSLYQNRPSLSLANISTTSFFPTKPLGCYGDGGAIFFNSKNHYEKSRKIKSHGSLNKEDYLISGMNSRLDTMQAAILIEKLKFIKKEIKNRIFWSKIYNQELTDKIQKPLLDCDQYQSSWALYSVRTSKRVKLSNYLKEKGINCGIYYSKPLHRYSLFKRNTYNKLVSLKNAEKISKDIISIPINSYYNQDQVDKLISTINIFFKSNF